MPKLTKKETKMEKEKRLKQEKPYRSCTWYPFECDAVGCDCGQGPCRDYLKEETW